MICLILLILFIPILVICHVIFDILELSSNEISYSPQCSSNLLNDFPWECFGFLFCIVQELSCLAYFSLYILKIIEFVCFFVIEDILRRLYRIQNSIRYVWNLCHNWKIPFNVMLTLFPVLYPFPLCHWFYILNQVISSLWKCVLSINLLQCSLYNHCLNLRNFIRLNNFWSSSIENYGLESRQRNIVVEEHKNSSQMLVKRDNYCLLYILLGYFFNFKYLDQLFHKFLQQNGLPRKDIIDYLHVCLSIWGFQ